MAKRKKKTWDDVGCPEHFEPFLDEYPDPNILVEILKATDVLVFEGGFEITEEKAQSSLHSPCFVVPLHEALWLGISHGWELYDGHGRSMFL